jgi:hypothetical protein
MQENQVDVEGKIALVETKEPATEVFNMPSQSGRAQPSNEVCPLDLVLTSESELRIEPEDDENGVENELLVRRRPHSKRLATKGK